MSFACWTNKAGDTLRMYNTYCFSTVTMVTRKAPQYHIYTHVASLIFSSKN